MTQKPDRNFKRLIYALGDQGAVSAGNFLVIALGAHFLTLAEQGKLVYAFGVYYGLVIFNVATFFTIPLLLRGDRTNWGCYRRLLVRWQFAFAVIAAVLVTAAIAVLGGHLDWVMSRTESLLLCCFYLLQQLSDFYRRSGYVFDQIAEATISSQIIFWLRVTALVLTHPTTLTGFLIILVLTASIGAIAALLRELKPPMPVCDPGKNKTLLKAHASLSKWGIINAPLTWGGLHLPILLVGAIAGKEAAAIVGSVRGITAFLNVLLELLETFIPTWLASKLTREGLLPLNPSIRLWTIGGAIWLLGLVLLFALGGQIVSLLLGKSYLPYTSMLLVIWLANGLYFTGRVIGLHYRMTRDTLAQTLGSGGGLVALLIALPLIHRNGEWGGAWSLVIVQLGVMITLGLYWMAKSRR